MSIPRHLPIGNVTPCFRGLVPYEDQNQTQEKKQAQTQTQAQTQAQAQTHAQTHLGHRNDKSPQPKRPQPTTRKSPQRPTTKYRRSTKGSPAQGTAQRPTETQTKDQQKHRRAPTKETFDQKDRDQGGKKLKSEEQEWSTKMGKTKK